MPVKVRCPGCQKVLNAPDKARGKSIKCPSCEGRVRVPVGKSSGTSAPPKKKKRPRKQAGGDDFLGGVNLDRLEDRSANVCPKCGATVYEEDEVCKACNIDLETGKIREKRRGPDPSLFYGEAWSNSWKFMLANRKLAFFSGFVWTLFIVLYIGGAVGTAACHNWEMGHVVEEHEAEQERDAKLKAKPGKKKVRLADLTDQQIYARALAKPPVVGLAFLTMLMAMGTPGWYWQVSAKVVEQTMRKKKLLEMKKVQFDFFNTIISGFKAYFWPYVLLMPVIFVGAFAIVPLTIAGSLAFGVLGAIGISLVSLGVYMIPIFVFPIAQVHMTMPYTYPAFLPYDMLRIFFRNIGPALYWLIMFLVVTAPVIIGVTILLVMFGNDFGPMIAKLLGNTITWVVEAVGEDPETKGFVYKSIAFGVASGILIFTTAAFMIPLAFAGLFLMRANGLLGYYNRRTLDLVTRKKPNVPCGFWVRYLAAMIDGLLMLIAVVLLNIAFDLATFGLNIIGYDFTLKARVYAFLGIFVIMPMYYYTKSESGIFQGTLGKRSLGIKVTDLNGNKISMKQAMGRYFGKILSGAILGAGYAMAGMTEQKQSLHDQLSKSLVVWEGSDDRG